MFRKISFVHQEELDEFHSATELADQAKDSTLASVSSGCTSTHSTPSRLSSYVASTSLSKFRITPVVTPTFQRKNSLSNPSADLETSLADCQKVVGLFFDNKFGEAKLMTDDWSSPSFYQSVAKSVFAFCQAILTFERSDIETASEIVKKSIDNSNNYRRKNSFYGWRLKKTDYNVYSEEQIHAELCYAESLLFQSVLTFAEDENLFGFIRGGLQIHYCYQSYKECWNILNQRDWESSPHNIHFESGVRLGVGSFNLFVSLLPQKVLKLLEFIGFNGTWSSREVGLNELLKGYELDSIRRPLCALVLLGYHLLILYALGHTDGDLVQASAILDDQLKANPNGVWFLFFKGRLELVQGNIPEAIMWYEESWQSQDIWPQFHHFCYWELIWAHSMLMNWVIAEEFAKWLFEESRWSKCIYAYLQASLLIMQRGESSLTGPNQLRLTALMRELPSYKQRIAGKSIPMEKFVIKKSERFFAQNDRLCLPVLELLYIWNYLKIIGKKLTMVENFYHLIERTMEDLERRKQEKYHADDLALVFLLKGCCLRSMNNPLAAEECFLAVLKLEKNIQLDTYLVPFSIFELGYLYYTLDKIEEAISWLETAKNNYKGYSLESKLHFRVHSVLSLIKRNTSASNSDNPPNPDLDLKDEN